MLFVITVSCGQGNAKPDLFYNVLEILSQENLS